MTQPFAIQTAVQGGKLDTAARDLVSKKMQSIGDGEKVLFAIMPTNDIIGALAVMPFDDVRNTLSKLQELCDASIEYQNPNACLDLLNELSAWIGQSAHLQASAKYYLCVAEAAQYAFILENIEDYKSMSATERKRLAASRCAEYVALYEFAERLNAAITHRCEHLRTFISFAKQEIAISNSTANVPQNTQGRGHYFPDKE